MQFKFESGVITCSPVGRIDSTNAKNFETAITGFRAQHQNAELVFDCQELEYISSAGLRVLLSLSKKANVRINLINVSQGVSNILDVTGFSTIFEVSRSIRDISGEKGHLMGESAGISLYRMDNDTILKLYSKTEKLEEIRKELKYAKAALLSGVPALISYDIVSYNGRYGILYEMPNVKTVSSLIVFQQWKLDHYAKEMGKTLRAIHSCTPEPGILPDTPQIFTTRALSMDKYFNRDEIATLVSLIQSIPAASTIVYGNYHPGNVFAMNDELILINMSGISCGNPVFDLGMSYMICVHDADTFIKRVSDIDMLQAKKFWDIMIRNYFDTDDENVIKHHETIIEAVAMLCSALSPAMGLVSQDDAKRLVEKARRDVLGYSGYMKRLLEEAIF